MGDFLSALPLFPLVLTVGAFQIGLLCQKKWKSPLCNPLLIAVIVVIAVLLLTGLPAERYQSGIQSISWLLTPATVSLAVPLYQQLKLLKGNTLAISAGIVAGTLSALGCVLAMCILFKLDSILTVSLLPKSITTAIGLAIAEQNGGLAPLTAIAIFITGLTGSVAGPIYCKLFKLKSPIAQGVAFGTAAHVIGTSKARELGDLQGAVSSLSLVIAGVLTAVIFPLLLPLIP